MPSDPASLLDQWLAHRQRSEADPGAVTVPAPVAPAPDTPRPEPIDDPVAAEDPPPSRAAGAPSAVEAGRVVLEAFASRLDPPAETGTTEASPDPEDLGSAAGASALGAPAQGETSTAPPRGVHPPAPAAPAAATSGSDGDGGDAPAEATGPASETGDAPDTGDAQSDARATGDTDTDTAVAPPAPSPEPAVPPATPSPAVEAPAVEAPAVEAPAATTETTSPAAAPAPAGSPTPQRRSPGTPEPDTVRFPPKRGGRGVLTVLALITLAAAGVAGTTAWSERTTPAIGLAAGLAVLAWLLWSARRRVTGTAVSIENGVLSVVQGSSRHRFPLTGTHPPIDVLGSPDDRSWKVLIQRRGMGPFVITRRMVDPAAFTETLRRYRPRA